MSTRPKVLFAAQGTPETGAGHIMRCLVYAKELSALGYAVDLFGEVTIPWLTDLVFENPVFGIASRETPYDLVIVDSYVEKFIDSALTTFCYRNSLQLVDSSTPSFEFDRYVWLDAHWPPAVLIEKNRFIGHGIPFMAVRSHTTISKLPDQAKRVLLLLGGSPRSEHIKSCLKLIVNEEYRAIEFEIFSGEIDISGLPSNINLHKLGAGLDSLINVCDTVITASGTSLWDFLASGRCVGAICVVENQENNYSFVTSKEIAAPLGDLRVNYELSVEQINKLLTDKDFRNNLVSKASKLVDQSGSHRFAQEVSSFLKSS